MWTNKSKCNLDLNTNVRADAKHVWKENIAKKCMAQHMRGAGMLASQME